jgi:hypothetical protein
MGYLAPLKVAAKKIADSFFEKAVKAKKKPSHK